MAQDQAETEEQLKTTLAELHAFEGKGREITPEEQQKILDKHKATGTVSFKIKRAQEIIQEQEKQPK